MSSQYSIQFKRSGHFHFFRIWSSAKPRPMKNVISQCLGLDLVNINVYAKVYQIFHSIQEIGLFSLFQNLSLGNASANPRWYLTISWATACQYQCVCKILSQYSIQFKRKGHFHFFRIWSSAKPRPTKNVISQSVGLDLVNINVYAKVYQNIPFSSRDRTILHFFRIWASATPLPIPNDIWQSLWLHLVNINAYAIFYQNIPNGLRVKSSLFSEFEPRQNLDQSQMSFDCLMDYIMSVSMCMQNFITIFHSVQEKGPFSLFQNFGARQSLDRWKNVNS